MCDLELLTSRRGRLLQCLAYGTATRRLNGASHKLIIAQLTVKNFSLHDRAHPHSLPHREPRKPRARH
jgi:hypothetical protein